MTSSKPEPQDCDEEELLGYIKETYRPQDIYEPDDLWDDLCDGWPLTHSKFYSEVVGWVNDNHGLLGEMGSEDIIDHIINGHSVEEVFNEDDIVDHVRESFRLSIEEVFREEDLMAWVNSSTVAVDIRPRVKALMEMGIEEFEAKQLIDGEINGK